MNKVFTKDSRIVKNYLLLINEGMDINAIPKLFNLREAVEEAVKENERQIDSIV